MKKLFCQAIALIVLFLHVPLSFAAGSGIVYGEGRKIAELANRAIDESSGIACGRANRDVFWTHNDSGDKPRLFAFNRKGEELSVVTVLNARNRDWEDMASFTYEGRHFLLVADVGDNLSRRDDYTLYIVAEPELEAGKGRVDISVVPFQTIRFHYEDGPHNCESVAIDPQRRTIYLVSKVYGNSCKVYSLPWQEGEIRALLVARAIATLNIPTTTAMDISPDGLRAVVLTYFDAFEFVRSPEETWEQGFSRSPRRIGMPEREQGEAICYGQDGKTLYLTSECENTKYSDPSPLLEVPVIQ
ncbi:MAG: hypothetical protein HGA78_05465 [Nitrospirales bacterium]|nr:hypothetical protein [Nitrospirales bacterium]